MFKMLHAAVCALVLILSSETAVQATETLLRVVDENGNAIDEFEVMWHTADRGYSRWSRERNGSCKLGLHLPPDVVDVIVRAKDFASRVQRFEGESLRTLGSGKATIILESGRQVTIDAQNLTSPIPEDFLMESFFSEFAWRVHMMWQPVNLRGQKKPDWNMLNVEKIDDSRFTVRISEHTGEFFLAFQHPGWLRFCEFGPFQADKVAAKGIRLPMPTPAKIRVTFDPGKDEVDRPFQSAKTSIYWAPDESGSVLFVTDNGVAIDENNPLAVGDLGPGKYMVDLRTTPKNEARFVSGTTINPGQFFDRDSVTLESGQTSEVAFAWTPFDPDAYRGTANAEILVKGSRGTVPSGRTIKVSWFDGHYGSLNVFAGALPDTGIIRLNGISPARHRSAAGFGPYTISIDDEPLGFFGLQETKGLQHFEFSVSPKAGDEAPDIELIALDSQQRQRLSDYRGKVVLLEFWATWCGPCQAAMQKLSELAANMPASWSDNVVLLSLSTDHDIEKVRSHVAARGWNGMPHFCAVRINGEHFSEAEKAYVVHGIPHAVLIDQNGTLHWRGHPSTPAEGKTVSDRINELLK